METWDSVWRNSQEVHLALFLRRHHGVQHRPAGTRTTVTPGLLRPPPAHPMNEARVHIKSKGVVYLLAIQSRCTILAVSARNTLLRNITYDLGASASCCLYQKSSFLSYTYRFAFGSLSPWTSFGANFTLLKHIMNHSCSHLYVHMACYIYIYNVGFFFLSTYNFSFWSSESLWAFFSNITLEASDETHTAIHWWDQPSLLAAVHHQVLCFFVFFDWCARQTKRDSLSCRWCRRCLVFLWSPSNPVDKKRKTHGKFVNDTFAPFAWKKLQCGELDCVPEVTYSVSYGSHRALQTPETTWALKTNHRMIFKAFKIIFDFKETHKTDYVNQIYVKALYF